MKTMIENQEENLTVSFYKVDAGWLYFKVTFGEQVFESAFSHVNDPIYDFKHWLEAIAIGVQQTSFVYNPEATEIKFDFEQISYNEERLTISYNEDDHEVLIRAKIPRHQVVKAFYLGLLNFAGSDKFISKEWEIEYVYERLCNALNTDKETLIESLVDLDRIELQELLFEANPSYYFSYPAAKNEKEALRLFFETRIKDKGFPDEQLVKRKPDKMDIPEHYDFWAREKKIEFIAECINEVTNDYHGTKINDFRSMIVEQYLDDKYGINN